MVCVCGADFRIVVFGWVFSEVWFSLVLFMILRLRVDELKFVGKDGFGIESLDMLFFFIFRFEIYFILV